MTSFGAIVKNVLIIGVDRVKGKVAHYKSLSYPKTFKIIELVLLDQRTLVFLKEISNFCINLF